jgi:ferredoxin
MRVVADLDVCQAFGLCALTAPEVFTNDDEGQVVPLIEGDVPAELEKPAMEGAGMCPVKALRVE